MAASLVSALLIEAPVNRHFAQLHRDRQGLTDAVALFLETGLRRGNAVVIAATPEHTDLFFERLRESDLDPAALRRAGQLELLDAEKLLGMVMRNDTPDWTEFRRVIGGVLERVKECGRGTTRVYGELVNVLWQQGRAQAAIQVEEFWNELARLHPFSLFCSYLLDPHHDECYAGPIEEIGRTHSDILGTADDERFRVALDSASRDVFGVPLSQMLGFATTIQDGQRRFPSGQRTMLWVKRNLPSASSTVLARARRYYEESLQ